MGWWIAGGVVVLSLVVLGLAVSPLLARRARLERALTAARARAAQAERLQEQVAAMQSRAEELQERVVEIQEHVAQSRRGRAG